eukprot:366289-Chlamydomonas_euryale.AAC.10
MSGTADDVARLQEALAALEARQADADAGGSGRAMANLNQRNMQVRAHVPANVCGRGAMR